MAHYKRGYSRTRSRGRRALLQKWWEGEAYSDKWNYMGAWPRWWDITNHTRPKRRDNARLIVAIRQGADPDAIAWPLGNHKPHRYYW